MADADDVQAAGRFDEWWLGRAPTARSLANVGLLMRIRESFALSQQTYGSRRVWKDLVVAGDDAVRIALPD